MLAPHLQPAPPLPPSQKTHSHPRERAGPKTSGLSPSPERQTPGLKPPGTRGTGVPSLAPTPCGASEGRMGRVPDPDLLPGPIRMASPSRDEQLLPVPWLEKRGLSLPAATGGRPQPPHPRPAWDVPGHHQGSPPGAPTRPQQRLWVRVGTGDLGAPPAHPKADPCIEGWWVLLHHSPLELMEKGDRDHCACVPHREHPGAHPTADLQRGGPNSRQDTRTSTAASTHKRRVPATGSFPSCHGGGFQPNHGDGGTG